MLDAMLPSSCPTYEHCMTLVADHEHLRLYEFLMQLQLEFEAVRAQMMH